MGVKRTVFGSKAEREIYHSKLIERWGKQYRIYPNLPFLMVFDVDELRNRPTIRSEPDYILSDQQLDFLKKTSSDFTVCDRQDRPLLCIEYDGWQEGVSTGTHYKPKITQATAEQRQWRMETKLNVAACFGFLYIVLASRHFEDLSERAGLSIVDAFLGEKFAYQAAIAEFRKFSPRRVGLKPKQFARLTPQEQHQLRYRWELSVIQSELDRHHHWRKDHMRLFQSYAENGIVVKERLLFPDETLRGSIEEIQRQVSDALFYGTKARVWSHTLGDTESIIWVPNQTTDKGFWGFQELSEDLALYLALMEMERKDQQSTFSDNNQVFNPKVS